MTDLRITSDGNLLDDLLADGASSTYMSLRAAGSTTASVYECYAEYKMIVDGDDYNTTLSYHLYHQLRRGNTSHRSTDFDPPAFRRISSARLDGFCSRLTD